jgi:hypothetical protein
MQIIPNQLGEAFSTGLNQLAQHKLSEVSKKYDQQQQRSQFVQAWAPKVGEDTANFLFNLSPKEREIVLGNPSSLVQLNQQQGQQGQMGGMAALGGQQPQEGQQQQQMTPERAQLIQDLFTSPHEKREREKLDLKKQQVESQTNKEAREFSSPYVEKANKAKANIRDYKELIKIAKTGNLRAGNTYQLLNKLGLQDFGRNSDTEKAGKLIARLAQNISGVFGTNARITNFLEQTFQRSLPSLINTPEGIEAISIINMAADEGEIVKNNIRKELIKKNGGRLTAEIEDEIDQAAEPLIRTIEEKAFRDAENVTRSKTKTTQQSFNDLPPAAQYKGKKIRDKESGKILQSNGQEWLPAE